MEIKMPAVPVTDGARAEFVMRIGQCSALWLEGTEKTLVHFGHEVRRWLEAWSVTSPLITLPRQGG